MVVYKNKNLKLVGKFQQTRKLCFEKIASITFVREDSFPDFHTENKVSKIDIEVRSSLIFVSTKICENNTLHETCKGKILMCYWIL